MTQISKETIGKANQAIFKCDQATVKQSMGVVRVLFLLALLVGAQQHALDGATQRLLPETYPVPSTSSVSSPGGSSRSVRGAEAAVGGGAARNGATRQGPIDPSNDHIVAKASGPATPPAEESVAQNLRTSAASSAADASTPAGLTTELPIAPPRLPSDLSAKRACRPNTEGDDDFRSRSGLFCIVAGMEHSSTTVTSAMIMSAPNLMGAFEGGLLVPDDPAGFNENMPEPFWYDHMVGNATARGGYDGIVDWGLSPSQRDLLTTASCHAEQYVILREHSPLFSADSGLQESWIVDKTPSYFRNLLSVMDRTPHVPVIVTQKSDEAIINSYVLKNRSSVEFVTDQLEIFKTELARCQEQYPDRLHVVNHTEMLEDMNGAMSKAFAFLGLRWVESYALREGLMQKALKIEQTWLQAKH